MIELQQPNSLSSAEIQQLEKHEGAIEYGIRGFLAVGIALEEIRDKKLYRDGYRTFEEYTGRRWGLSHSRSYQYMEASRVAEPLSKILDISGVSESTMRVLSKAPEDERGPLLEEARTRNGGEAPTARGVSEVMTERAYASTESDDEDERAAALFGNHGPSAGARIASPPPRLVNRGVSLGNERFTPSPYIESARRVFGGRIDVDPASCAEANETVKALTFYDQASNGLDKPWRGCVWLNPPYGVDDDGNSNAGRWATRLVDQYRDGVTTAGILCVNALPWSPWFQQLWDLTLCFTDHRITFPKPVGAEPDKHGPSNGTAFAYLGRDREAFIREFRQYGAVVTRLHHIALGA